jgi:hypothetical protein
MLSLLAALHCDTMPVRNEICRTEHSSAIYLQSMHHGKKGQWKFGNKYPMPTIPYKTTSGKISNDRFGAG